MFCFTHTVFLFCGRFLCTARFADFFCPLGAIYSFFNKKAVFGIKVDKTKCTHCNACVNSCKMDTKEINDRECIRCGECKSKCGFGAIK
ncbi:MAG: 4Fe-4S binding protein [Spirochaetota bacterium]|nr:4Fe-4S binding protein [Spirochaetota bacterium]